jgi:hypothetical protein
LPKLPLTLHRSKFQLSGKQRTDYHEPAFSFRADPRYTDMLRRMNLAP